MEQIKEAIEESHLLIASIRKEISKELVGQDKLVDSLLTGLLTGGHILIEGVPGLAKTRAVKALASAVQAQFKRIQFTPDLLPADLTGTEIYRPKTADFITRKGPLFNNIILADEINRAPSKVQSALLEAMEEKQVTIGDQTYLLPSPFLVLATQNPIEQEGTYPLPEAQVDRFMLKVCIDYPDKTQELEILKKNSFQKPEIINPVISCDQLAVMGELMDQIYVDEKLKEYIVDLIFSTRQPEKYGMDMAEYIEFGASPRASIFLAKAARVNAFLSGRAYVTPQDIKLVGPDVLRHRIILSFEAEAEDISCDTIIQNIFDSVEVP
ncbi:MAG: MoxR family ATPase [Proteobacteria bacterium]|nr:MoxR family ATPase [Pseudomonadota bacterium]MBU1585998.1 MoxR family ATPase [Pseudomonadota bacterium]MBU2454058.1 MoxR family ATPase [Pseudomonadota bacterium]MBU2630089.1 MoxR family ATPase [Pseudomonadota bacterium]